MKDPNDDGTTSEGEESYFEGEVSFADEETTEAPQDQEEAQEASPEEPAAEKVDGELLPEQFNDDPEKFIKSYNELRSKLSEVGTERSHAERVAEELQSRVSQLEQAPAATPPVQDELDPEALFDQDLETYSDNPKEAIKRYVQREREGRQRDVMYQQMNSRAESATKYYQSEMKDNPDFAEREPDMQRLAKQYEHIINPMYANSPEMIKVLYALAKGQDSSIESYKAQAVEEAKKAGNLVRSEKKKAFSETSASKTSSTKDVSEMTMEEMEAELRKSGDLPDRGDPIL